MKPTIGRIVTYKVSAKDGLRGYGQLRPAVVTDVFPDEFGPGTFGLNLHVFADGVNDFADGRLGFHVYSAQLVELPVEGQCAWPARGDA